MRVAVRRERQVRGLKMGSQHLPSSTFYAILDPLVKPSQSIVGCTDLKVEGGRRGELVCACVCARVSSDGRAPHERFVLNVPFKINF